MLYVGKTEQSHIWNDFLPLGVDVYCLHAGDIIKEFIALKSASYDGMGMRTSLGGEDCGFKPVSLTQEWGLDVKVVTPFPFLFKTCVPWVYVNYGGIFQVHME
ncbi:hypothetical protein Tco_0794647 [Tanacetum coccineum]